RRGLDSARDAAQLRLTAVRLWRADREHRPPGRPRGRLRGHRDCVPQADPPRAAGGRGGDGSDLLPAPWRGVVTQIVTHSAERPRPRNREGPVSWEPPIGIEPMTYSLRV